MAIALIEHSQMFRSELAGFEPSLLSGEDCRVLAEELARTEKACAAARARAAVRVEACGSFRTSGFGDAAGWLARSSGSSHGQANAELNTATALARCPETEAALVAGQLSLAQAGEIARTEAACPGSEAELVALAQETGLAVLREQARKLRLEAISVEELAARQRKARSVRHWRDELGMLRFSVAFEPTVGLPILSRLEAETDRVRREARRTSLDEPREAHAADALASMLSGVGRAKGNATRADVVFVCDIRAYRRGRAKAGEQCHVVGGGPVPVTAVNEAAAGGFVKGVVHDGDRIQTVAHFGRRRGAELLDTLDPDADTTAEFVEAVACAGVEIDTVVLPGRRSSAELRTALELGRPPGFGGAVCVEPGCGRRYGLEWDHVDPVNNRGPTSFANLQPRCWPCHRAKTERDRQAGLLGAWTPECLDRPPRRLPRKAGLSPVGGPS